MDGLPDFNCGRCRKGMMLRVKGKFADNNNMEFWACNVCYHTLATLGSKAPKLYYDAHRQPFYELPPRLVHYVGYDMGTIVVGSGMQVVVGICGNTVLPSMVNMNCGMLISMYDYYEDRVKLGHAIIPVRRAYSWA